MASRKKSCDLNRLITFTPGGILSRVVLESEHLEATLFCLAAGSGISEHTAGREAAITVLRGRGVFTLEGRRITMSPGVFISMKPGAPHSLKATEDLAFLLLLGS